MTNSTYSEVMPDQALSVRKRQSTRNRISTTAARLVSESGLAGTTVDQIAASAEVGRATFFRYFNAKEAAVAEGMARHWLDVIAVAVASQPAHLSAPEAVLAAFSALGDQFADVEEEMREMAAVTRSSPTLNAWTLQFYLGYENAIAEAIAPRLETTVADDPRPRLLGALAMAAIRISLDDWLLLGGSLPDRVRTALSCIAVRGECDSASQP
jgi:AcrR family transcriptional regulator